MKQVRLITIDPDPKIIQYETYPTMDDYVKPGQLIAPVMPLSRNDYLFVLDPEIITTNFFVVFNWVAQTFMPMKIFNKAFIAQGDMESVGMTLYDSRFIITFPLVRGGWIDGIQN